LINNRTYHRQETNTIEQVKNTPPYNLSIAAFLNKDPTAYGFYGEVYKVDEHAGIYAYYGYNKTDNSGCPVVTSAQNLVQVSDNVIKVDIGFKMPLYPNSTMERIERINSLYDVNYIDTQPDFKRFISFSNSPLTINNTNYSNLRIEFKQLNEEKGYLYIDGYMTGLKG
jgi:hypothetical protein